ncbi:hypothetical protein GCM10027578_21890 [Spirosoma luteolum]
MTIVLFALSTGGAFCFGYYRGMGFILRNYEGFKHYVDDVLDDLKISKAGDTDDKVNKGFQ